METLKFLLQSKRGEHNIPKDVVETASAWVKGQFENAGIKFLYSQAGFGHGVYGYFQIESKIKGQAITLHLKIAEINSRPFAFSDIRVRGAEERVFFPFFGDIGTEDGRISMLHYIADFVLSGTQE